jgi:exocyst complex component 4
LDQVWKDGGSEISVPLLKPRMSRVPPFPTSRRRSPSNANRPISPPISAPGYSNTRPLHIPRSSTPTNSNGPYVSGSPQQYGLPPNSAPLGPSRPQRSELRARASDYSSDRGSVVSSDVYRESMAESEAYNVNPAPPSRSRTPRQATSPYSANGDNTTPTSLNSALSAFKSAVARKKTLESDDAEYWSREREREIEEEKARQQRIRDRVPGLNVVKGKKRAGEIDGVLLTILPHRTHPHPHPSCPGSSERWMGVCYRS